MYKLRIVDKGLENVQEANRDQIRVAIEIFQVDDQGVETEVVERVLGFALGTDFDTIKAELAKYLETFKLEREQAIANKALDEAYEKSNDTLSKLEGLELE